MSAGRPREIDDVTVARMHRSGIPIAKIAEWLGKTRSGVYVAIRRARGQRGGAAVRITALEAALVGLRRSNGHYTERCTDGRCVLACRVARQTL
jgi:IS30 family transposase